MSHHISRRHYADIYGPTTGDRIRLGDTDLWVRVEDDRVVEKRLVPLQVHGAPPPVTAATANRTRRP